MLQIYFQEMVYQNMTQLNKIFRRGVELQVTEQIFFEQSYGCKFSTVFGELDWVNKYSPLLHLFGRAGNVVWVNKYSPLLQKEVSSAMKPPHSPTLPAFIPPPFFRHPDSSSVTEFNWNGVSVGEGSVSTQL